MSQITFGILTVSDSCYNGLNEDRSGPALAQEVLSLKNLVIFKDIVPDSESRIRKTLKEWSHISKGCNVILTTGGTGFSSRDVTPEATKSVIDKEAPALVVAMTVESLKITDLAVLSRSVCGIKNKTLIINLPGSAKAATECFRIIRNAIPHAVAVLTGQNENVAKTHREIHSHSISCGQSKVTVDQPACRNRESPYPMIEVSQALKLIRETCVPTSETESIEIEESLGRILAEDVHADDPLPPFPASIKDGYAIKASDGPGLRSVRNVVIAGDAPSMEPLQNGEAIRISTGAPVPEGADAVVQVEDTELVESSSDMKTEIKIEIKSVPVVGQDIRSKGSDIPAGSTVLRHKDCITPSLVGVLATVGKRKISVYKRPAVGVISTGNEIQSHREELTPGRIRDSNKLTLLNLLKQHGFEANDCGIAKDVPNDVKEAFEVAFSKNDVIVTTGGVSMGECDVVKQVLVKDFNAVIHFGRLNMKPGKPTTFVRCMYNQKLKIIFALPGNPVSATVTSILFVIPALRHMERHKNILFPRIKVIVGKDIELDPRPEYVRVQLKHEKDDNLPTAYPTGNQISSRLNSFVDASALLIVPGKNTLGFNGLCPKGAIIDALLIDPFNID